MAYKKIEWKLLRNKKTHEIKDYELYRYQNKEEWEEIYPDDFTATFKFEKFEGWSSPNAKMRCTDNNLIYHMFLSEFEKLLLDPNALWYGKTITGTWGWRKQGKAFSIVYKGH